MLENGQSSHKSKPLLSTSWESLTEKRVYTGTVSLALLLMVLALALGLWSDHSVSRALLAAQFGTGLLVVCFIAFNDIFTLHTRLKPAAWYILVSGCGLAVVLTALLSGENFNVMLAPLLVVVTYRHTDPYIVLKLGAGAVLLVMAQLLVSALLGLSHPAISGAGTSLTAIAALTLSLATVVRHYRRTFQNFQAEADDKASEMAVAREIQASLMPPNHFQSGNWTLAARSVPAHQVGGDFYEYVYHPHLENTISGIAIGDVAGKGIPAALQMAVARTLFRVEARRRIFPGKTLISVNKALQAERSFGMTTMLYAFIEVQSNLLYLANAGHNYPLVLNDRLEEIELSGLPLGIDDGIEYEEKVYQITPGTSIIFYTDGLVEAMNQEGELFSFESLKQAVENNRHLDPESMVERILAEIAAFTSGTPQSDDMTILVLQYHPQPTGTGEPARPDRTVPARPDSLENETDSQQQFALVDNLNLV